LTIGSPLIHFQHISGTSQLHTIARQTHEDKEWLSLSLCADCSFGYLRCVVWTGLRLSRCAWVLRHLQLMNQTTPIIHYLPVPELIVANGLVASCAAIVARHCKEGNWLWDAAGALWI
jgi:hypothetical protein